MPNENYYNLIKLKNKNDNCDSNVYYSDPLSCAHYAKWKGPGGGKFSFYTTWSFYLNIGVLIISFLILLFHIITPQNRIKNTLLKIITPVIIGTIINIIGVFTVSQILLAFDWSIKSDKNNLAVSNKFIIKINKINFFVHQLPLFFIIIFIALLKIFKQKINKKILTYSLIFIIIFFIIWDCVPINKSDDGTIKGKTNIFNKFKYVYNSPPLWIAFILPLSWIIISFLIFFMTFDK